MSSVVTTLFESGPYEAGVAALLNSLVASGFSGRVWCGVRGPVPAWLDPTAPRSAGAASIEVRTVSLAVGSHLALHKPHFLRDVAGFEPDAASVVYFDPDVVVKCEWPFVERWAGRGIAAVTDLVGVMPASSPVRRDWLELCATLGVDVPSPAPRLDVYCNAGFVGVSRTSLGFLDLWAELIDAALASRADTIGPLVIRPGGTNNDQDLFNVALMGWSDRVSLMGPEAMDFVPGGMVFSHACAGPIKPWDGRYLRSALAGRPPQRSVRAYLANRGGPFDSQRRWRIRAQLFQYQLARAIGMLASRSAD